ncbi:hypothetical protein MPDQ_007446 [Monascus purpureus]|uniref:Methyltransferase domain-containing protein n=1 Tax=Monascus purpureus TaxID=5098 RepID=A0A507QW34_MONPU|nr:hypothetical protein MPDQ_007446 [Monascus purpureus]BDD57552.1 hypothetical protein MAP00_002906 [Monascus purpureus]
MADTTAEGVDNNPITVDDTVSELDSTFSEAGSDTTSLTSSVLKYRFEHGRRYHGYRDGRYLLPNDEKEQDRMDILSFLFTLALDGELFLAPIEKHPQRILDLGCGTGQWAIDIGDMFPSAQVIGNDLSPIQPSMVPPNVQFEVDDIESDWAFRTPFDFIHGRYLASAVRDWPRLFQQTYQNLKPGGYCEFLDFDFTYRSDDGSIKETHDLYINSAEFIRAANILGQEPCPGPKFRKWAEETGFVNIKEHTFKIPNGPWPKDSKLKELGAWNRIQSLEGFEAWTMGMFTRVLGWSPEEVQVHLARARQDIRNPDIHAYVLLYVVYAQKPKEKGKANDE